MANQVRDNFKRFQKQATINFTKKLESLAKDAEIDLSQKVAEKLKECYKDNVEQSYGPRSVGAAQDILFNEQAKKAEMEYNKDKYGKDRKRFRRKRIPYINTGTFLESVGTIIDDHKVKVIIRDLQYPNGKSTTEVYEYLINGTAGGGYYKFRNSSGKTKTAYNYPTPKHEFEEHTMVQMLGYLDSLENDLRRKKLVFRKFDL